MKNILLITLFISSVAQAEMVAIFDNQKSSPYKYQVGLGYSLLNMQSNGVKEDVSFPSVTGKLGVKGQYSGDTDFGVIADIGYYKQSTEAVLLGNLQLELGWRFFIDEKFSLAPHLNAGVGYVSYENNTVSWVQINQIQGFVFSYGANLEGEYKIKENFIIGAKVQWNQYKLNVNTESSMSTLTLSVFVQYNF